MAPNAQSLVNDDSPGSVILGYGPGGAAHQTGTVLAVHAGNRDVLNAGIGELSLFDPVNPSEGRLTSFRIDIYARGYLL